MKFRRRHLRQLERFVGVRVVPFALAVLVVWFGSNAFLESASMLAMHHHACFGSQWIAKTNTENSSGTTHVHEHCQFCFAPALASGVPSKFSLTRLRVVTLKLEPQHQLSHNQVQFQVAAPRAPPVQTISV